MTSRGVDQPGSVPCATHASRPTNAGSEPGPSGGSGARCPAAGSLADHRLGTDPAALGNLGASLLARSRGRAARGRLVAPVVLVTAAFTAWAGLGWWIACRITGQGYRSEEGRRRGIRAGLERGEAAGGPARARFGWELPGLSPGTAAVARATFHPTRRVPEVLVSLALAVVVPWLFLQGWLHSPGGRWTPPSGWLLLLWILLAMVSQSGWLANQHGLAGPGLALWVLSPLDRTRMVQGHTWDGWR